MKVDGTTKRSVASVRQGCDDESGRVTEVLVVVLEHTVDDLGPDVVILPIVTQL